ncbi:MAG: CapA family protein [Bacteroidales bacterium]|jgi:poly-gamma-glutamate synthesis protein (capsule biosynthesis protein)
MKKTVSILYFFWLLTVPPLLFSQEKDRVRFCFTGDLMQHGAQIRSARQEDGSFAYDTCFAYIKDRMKEADFTVINMETSFSGPPYTGYPLFSSPNELAYAVRRAGGNVFLTANNHILDKGEAGAFKTTALYDSLEIPHCGTTNPWIILRKHGLHIALLNYTYGTNNSVSSSSFPMNHIDTTLIKEHLAQVRKEGADAVLCCMHWGVEYDLHPSFRQRSLSNWLRRQGVTAVIGAHPHVPQRVESYRDSVGDIDYLVAYSLGNFISNQQDIIPRMGMILTFDMVLTENGPRIESPWFEWVWTWRPVSQNKMLYHVLPVSDPRLYRKVVTNPADTLLITKTLNIIRNYINTTSFGIFERRRYPPYERKNLYFGEHPPVRALRARQPVFTSFEGSVPSIENYRKRRTTESTGSSGRNSAF